MSPVLLLALIPYALCVLAACIALFAAAVEQLPSTWCSVVHRASHFHGLRLNCCRNCNRLWLSVVQGGGEPGLLRTEPPALRSVGGRRG